MYFIYSGRPVCQQALYDNSSTSGGEDTTEVGPRGGSGGVQRFIQSVTKVIQDSLLRQEKKLQKAFRHMSGS